MEQIVTYLLMVQKLTNLKQKILKLLLKIYNDVWNGIKNKIEEVSSGECDYEKDYMEIKSNSDDDLSLKKPLKVRNMIIIIRSVFEEDGKRYPQVFLDDTLYKLNIKKC